MQKQDDARRTRILLDTDIGDDIDDAYALALLCASPELDLLGVTTVFRNTVARARLAQTVLLQAGRGDVPVAAGCGVPLSSRLDFLPGDLPHGRASLRRKAAELLDDSKPSQFAAALPDEKLPALDSRRGPEFLIETLMSGNGDITVVTIGAMTNLAVALALEPRLVSRIPRIVAMAGVFSAQGPEWNIRCDPVAASLVFESGIPMTVVGLDVTLRCRLTEEQVARLGAGTTTVQKTLEHARVLSGYRQPVLHDPLAVMAIFRPDLVKTRRGRVTVELCGDVAYGVTRFSPDDQGPHNVCFEVDSEAAVGLWLKRILSL